MPAAPINQISSLCEVTNLGLLSLQRFHEGKLVCVAGIVGLHKLFLHLRQFPETTENHMTCAPFAADPEHHAALGAL
jgi:hypothetical protein